MGWHSGAKRYKAGAAPPPPQPAQVAAAWTEVLKKAAEDGDAALVEELLYAPGISRGRPVSEKRLAACLGQAVISASEAGHGAVVEVVGKEVPGLVCSARVPQAVTDALLEHSQAARLRQRLLKFAGLLSEPWQAGPQKGSGEQRGRVEIRRRLLLRRSPGGRWLEAATIAAASGDARALRYLLEAPEHACGRDSCLQMRAGEGNHSAAQGEKTDAEVLRELAAIARVVGGSTEAAEALLSRLGSKEREAGGVGG